MATPPKKWLPNFWSVIVQVAGSVVGNHQTLNLSSGFTAADDPVNDRVNITIGGSSTQTLRARAVAASNVSNFNAMPVGQDGVTLVAGDVVLLVKQTSGYQNGPYVVGAVTAGNAPITRPDWWPNGGTFLSGAVIEVGGEGGTWGLSTWKAFNVAGVIGTLDPQFVPRLHAGTVTLASGKGNVLNLWVAPNAQFVLGYVTFTNPGFLQLTNSSPGLGNGNVSILSSSGNDSSIVGAQVKNF